MQLINKEEIDNISFGDSDFKKELIEIFNEQIPAFISNMEDYLKKNELKNLAREAHTAKSSVMAFGMIDTGNALKNIQLQAEDGITDNLRILLNKVTAEMNQALDELQELSKEL